MRIIRKGNIIQLSFLPRIFPVNCYLVEENEQVTLVDAALPYSAVGITKAVERVCGKPLTRIILTHAHEDHIGSLDRLKSMHPEVSVCISSRDSRLLQGDVTLNADEPQTPIRGGIPKDITTKPDVLLEEGDFVGSLQVIATPGHTPGSISLLDTRSGALIAGDAFQVRGGIAVSGIMQVWFPFPALATWNKQKALQSAQKMVNLKPTMLAVGHGNIIENPVQFMNKAIVEAEKALNK